MSKYIVAIDLGGTSAKCAIVDLVDNSSVEFQIATIVNKNNKNSDQILKNLKKGVDEQLLKKIKNSKKIFSSASLTGQANISAENLRCELEAAIADIAVVGITIPGTYNFHSGIVALAPNIYWENYNVLQNVQKLWPNSKVIALNDGDAAALGQYYINREREKNIILYVLGTGVGGGIVVNGKLVFDSNGFSVGEFGHRDDVYNKQYSNIECNCGLIGCLETVASATALNYNINEYISRNPYSLLAQYKKENQLSVLTTYHLNKFLQTVSPPAAALREFNKILQPAMEALADHIITMKNYDYDAKNASFYLAGGVTKLGDNLLTLLQKELKKKMPKENIKVSISVASDKLPLEGLLFLTKKELKNKFVPLNVNEINDANNFRANHLLQNRFRSYTF